MAAKAKTTASKTVYKQNKPKRTRQGQGVNSKRKSATSRKLSRGQG